MKDHVTRILLISLAIVVLVLLVSHYYNNKSKQDKRTKPVLSENKEHFSVTAPSQSASSQPSQTSQTKANDVKPSEPTKSDSYRPVDYKDSKKVEQCAPKDKLQVEDLLPKDAANSKWAQVVPSGQGDVSNQNYLTAGYLVGVNTVGPTLRNANQQLRSDPPIERMSVGPWNQTTIEYDSSRKFFEIGEC
jgi:hypothetical protein